MSSAGEGAPAVAAAEPAGAASPPAPAAPPAAALAAPVPAKAGAVKAPASGFVLYGFEQRAALREALAAAGAPCARTDVQRALGERWRALTPDERKALDERVRGGCAPPPASRPSKAAPAPAPPRPARPRRPRPRARPPRPPPEPTATLTGAPSPTPPPRLRSRLASPSHHIPAPTYSPATSPASPRKCPCSV